MTLQEANDMARRLNADVRFSKDNTAFVVNPDSPDRIVRVRTRVKLCRINYHSVVSTAEVLSDIGEALHDFFGGQP